MFSSQLDQGLRLQPLALAESGDGRGQEKSAKDALSLGEGPACWKPPKQASLRSVFLAGREEAKPLGLPDKDNECGGKAATKPHQGSTPNGQDRERAWCLHESLIGCAEVPKEKGRPNRIALSPRSKLAYLMR